jgi:hypothetical protein
MLRNTEQSVHRVERRIERREKRQHLTEISHADKEPNRISLASLAIQTTIGVAGERRAPRHGVQVVSTMACTYVVNGGRHGEMVVVVRG